MKTVFSITGVFMLLFALSCVKEEVPLNETSSEGEIILGYDYPIKPGTTEWEKLVNAQEKISVCQIPPSILSTLTTEELVNTCLRYPPLNNIVYNGDTGPVKTEDSGPVITVINGPLFRCNYKCLILMAQLFFSSKRFSLEFNTMRRENNSVEYGISSGTFSN